MKRFYGLLSLVIFVSFQWINAQGFQVTGKVTSSEDGLSLPGVSIIVKGTTLGSITNLNGEYTLQVPSDTRVLIFSFVGMKTQEVSVEGRTTIDLVMFPDVVGLDEVVVTAIGIRRETRALGYTAEAVNGEELLGSGENNIIQSLASKAAGLQITSSAGTPGASSKITLRGNSTFTGENQPLIIVDGVPIDNSTTRTEASDYPYNEGLQGVNYANRGIDLNPDDIESVTILKGPAAAALYGVRAGAGALVYTTKRGNYGKAQGIRATYSFSADISQVNKLPDLQMTWAQGDGGGLPDTLGGYTQGVYDVCDWGPDMIAYTNDDVSSGTPNSWGPKITDLANLGVTATDNLAEFFQTATTYSHNLSLMGGSETSSFRLSIMRMDQDGIVPNSFFDKTSIRLTSDANITAKWKMGGTVNYIASSSRRTQNGSNLSGVMLALTRCPASYDLNDEEYGYEFPTGQQRQYYEAYDNPWWSVYNNVFNDKVDRILGSAYLTWTPFKWLTGTYRVGLDIISDNRKFHWAPGAWNADDFAGEVHEDNQRHDEYYGDLLLTANYDFTDKINASLTIGNNFNHRYDQDLFARGRSINVPDLYNIGNTSTLYADEDQTYIRTAALFFDLNASYGDLLFLNATGRNEWSSTFGPNRSNFFYPSVSLSFVFTELVPENNILSFGKLRLAYAQSGISPLPYTSKTYYLAPFITDGFTNGASFPYMGNNGFGISNILGNPDLKPERVTGKEIGTDLRFFLGRLNIDFTYYNQMTTDILVLRPIAATSGFQFMRSNTGEMANRGVELIVSGDPVKTSTFNWNISFNWSKNYNEVLRLAEGVPELSLESGFSDIGSYAIVGDSYGAFYGTKWVRDGNDNLVINPSTGLPYREPLESNIGNPFPEWMGGLRNTFTFRGLTLTALLDVREGQSVWCGTMARLHRIGRTEESADRERMYLIPGVLSSGLDADGNPIPGTESNNVEISAYDYFTKYVGDMSSAAKEQSIYDASWIRLREVGLSYKFNLTGKIPGIHTLDLGFTGRNLWLKTDYPGVDPETSLLGAGSNINGWDYFNMPGSKSYIFTIKLGL
jgi:TonB-linked SusC/RagA family outer membrane protein